MNIGSYPLSVRLVTKVDIRDGAEDQTREKSDPGFLFYNHILLFILDIPILFWEESKTSRWGYLILLVPWEIYLLVTAAWNGEFHLGITAHELWVELLMETYWDNFLRAKEGWHTKDLTLGSYPSSVFTWYSMGCGGDRKADITCW